MSETNVINGKTYPLWQQFVDKKEEWIGGLLIDHDDCQVTIITDVCLKPNGTDSAFFSFEGEDYGCGFDVHHGGIGGEPILPEGLPFRGYDLQFTVVKKDGAHATRG
jgi:hypothetical protein